MRASLAGWAVLQWCEVTRNFRDPLVQFPLATATNSAIYLRAAAPLIAEVVLTLAMARDLGLVLAVWAIAWAALTGLGIALRRLLGLELRHARDVGDGFWLGLALTILCVQLWHFVLPLDGRATLLLVGLGFAGLAWNHAAIRRAWSARRTSPSTLARAAVAVAVVWIAVRAIGPSSFYDTGMYHMPVVAWSNEFPVVAGLGNLHDRLGFNSSSLLVAALLDVGPLDGASLHLSNGLLLTVLAVEALLALAAARRGVEPEARELYLIGLLPLVLDAAVRPDVRSLSTDAAATVVLLAGCGMLLQLLAYPAAADARRRPWPGIVLATLAAALCVKLSVAVFAALGCAIVLALTWPRRGDPARTPLRFSIALFLPALLVISLLARGAILSGYPLYPSTMLALPVDWRVPAEQAHAQMAWISTSARILNSNVLHPGSSWIVPWIRGVTVRGDLFVNVVVPSGLLLLALCARAWLTRSAGRGESTWAPRWRLIWIPIAGSIAFWAITAPHPRLGQAFFWGAAAIAIAVVVDSYGALRLGSRHRAAWMTGMALLVMAGLLLLKHGAGAAVRAGPGERALAMLEALVVRPSSGRMLAPLDTPELRSFTTASGLTVHVPVNDNACLNGPLLCTPHPSPRLRLRDRADIGRGFATEGGEWVPARWPNPWSEFLAYWRCSETPTAEGRSAREHRCLIEARRTRHRDSVDTSVAVPEPTVPARVSGRR